MSDRGLRQRGAVPPTNNNNNNENDNNDPLLDQNRDTNGHHHQNQQQQNHQHQQYPTDMAYGRRERPVIAYPSAGRGAAANAPVRNNYRNKIITVLLVTVVYTAFLYRSGTSVLYLYHYVVSHRIM
jgi:hypothetical protein